MKYASIDDLLKEIDQAAIEKGLTAFLVRLNDFNMQLSVLLENAEFQTEVTTGLADDFAILPDMNPTKLKALFQ